MKHKEPLPQRYEQLDALRGIASLQVMNHHILLMSPLILAYNFEFLHSTVLREKLAFLFTFTPLHFLWMGPEAVLFFFVLSGFVLSSALSGPVTFTAYKQYLIKRFFRLYAPFMIIILVSIFLRMIIFHSANTSILSDWFRGMWNHSVSPGEYLSLIVFKLRDVHNVVTTLWSIEVELKLSILVPAVLLLLNFFKKHTWLNLVINLGLLLLAFFITDHYPNAYVHNPGSIYDHTIIHFTFPFMAGIVLHKYSDTLSRLFYNTGKLLVFILLAVVIFFYCIDWIGWTFGKTALTQKLFTWTGNYTEAIKITASCLFILLSFNKHLHRLLMNKWLLHLGRISFSLYLVHPVLILVAGYCLVDYVSLPVIMVVTWLSSLIAAHYTYKLMERPINDYGRKLAKKAGNKAQNRSATPNPNKA